MLNYMEKSIKRVLSISSVDKYDDISDVNFFLVREYFRRVAIMFTFLDKYYIPSPIFDCYKIFDMEYQVVVHKEIDEIKEELRGKIKNAYITSYLIEYVKWNSLIDLKVNVAIKNKEMYEPLIKIFENGCAIGFHHGEFMVGRYSLSKINISDEINNEPFNFY